MFKVGDKAIIVKNIWGHDWSLGNTVTILELTHIQPIRQVYNTFTHQDEYTKTIKVQEYRAEGYGHAWYVLDPELQSIVPKLNKLICVL